MPHLFRANMFTNRYEFEVCDAPAGKCPHKAPFIEHRLYSWSKAKNSMTIAQMLQEIKALEMARAAQDTPVSLPQEGQTV